MSNSEIGENLRRIRSAKRLSQERVAARAGLSRSAYRSIEAGQALPRVRNLEAIARGLEVPVRELLEPVSTLTHVRFRSHEKLRSRARILARVGRWLADYNALEELLACARPFRLQGLEVREAGPVRPLAMARAARAALGLTAHEPIRDVCGLLDSAGVKLCPMVVASEGFGGLSVAPPAGGPAVVVNTWERIAVERWIFSAAHELGHLLLHHEDYRDDREAEEAQHEREADAFAAEFLMPEEVFRREWRESYGLPLTERVLKIKRMFHVSYRTVLHRLEAHDPEAASLWGRFRVEVEQRGATSAKRRERAAPRAAEAAASAAPELLRGHEPEHLSPADFREDRLAGLVRRGVESGAISLARGGEILGLTLREMRALAAAWVD